MKTIKLITSLCILLALSSCKQDLLTDFATNENADSQEMIKWNPAEGIKRWIPKEYADNIPAAELAYTESLLRNEKPLEIRRSEIRIPGGTTNKLAAAIAQATNGEVIVLERGDHFETGTVTIAKGVTIEGYGANLIFSNTAHDPTFTNHPAALHIKRGAEHSTIRGINFKGADPIPGLCMFIDSVDYVRVLSNNFDNWIYGIFTYSASHLIIAKNKMKMNNGWLTGAVAESEGISMSDGRHCQVMENEISGGLFGIWTGGSQGIAFHNNTYECYEGIILCKVPNGAYVLANRRLYTQTSTNKWLTMFNKSNNNYAAGIIVIDGAHNNFLEHNTAQNNAEYDNYAIAYSNMRVKDCGKNNRLRGGMVIEGPCQ
jgi:hypothetical protein